MKSKKLIMCKCSVCKFFAVIKKNGLPILRPRCSKCYNPIRNDFDVRLCLKCDSIFGPICYERHLRESSI